MADTIDVSGLPEDQAQRVQEFVAFLEDRYRQLALHAPDSGEKAKADTLADFLEDYIGVLHSSELVPGGANLSAARASKFTDLLVAKRKDGRL